jgi:hypothetical protein
MDYGNQIVLIIMKHRLINTSKHKHIHKHKDLLMHTFSLVDVHLKANTFKMNSFDIA